MEKTIQKIPFLRITIALALGIVLGTYFIVPKLMIILILLLILVVLIILNNYYKYSFNTLFGLGIHIFFIFLGIFIFQQYNIKPHFFEKGEYIATVLETPQEKPNSYKSVLQIQAFYNADSVSETNEKIIVYFGINENITKLKPGDVLLCNQIPQLVKNNGNPFEFDYKKYLDRKRIYRQVYLLEENWIKTNKTNVSISLYAENLREELLNIYRQQSIDKTELEILSALTLGYKRDLEPETKRVFSSAGAMHILAVSGLHVGIIFWVISLLFGFLKRRKRGRFFFVCLSILLLWGYAFITGLSPSVMRASTMFTIYIIGENLQRKANIYNSLSASALFLLLINPNSLFDVGFQLSYCAVFGIVFLQPKINSLITLNNKIFQFFWTLLTVSIAAQVATFPLSVYYFNQIPTYFWITNIVIIPAVMILIPAGIALLLFSKIYFLGTILSLFINTIIKSIYFILVQIEILPKSVLHFAVNPVQLFLILGTLFSVLLFLKNHRHFYIKTMLIFVLLISTSVLYLKINQLNKNEIIVFNNPQNTTIQLIHGKNNYIISEKKITPEENIAQVISVANLKRGLDSPVFLITSDTISDENILLRNGMVFFEGKIISMNKKATNFKNSLIPDFLINPNITINTKTSDSKYKTIITNNSYSKKANPSVHKIHFTYLESAFRENW